MKAGPWVSAALAGALALPAAALAVDATFSASAGVTSDYVFRGVSQSLEDPALQAGLHVEHASGLFAGAWASTVDSPSYQLPEGTRDVEVDLYLGYGFEITGPWSLIASLVAYEYPGAGRRYDYDYVEWGLALQRGPLSVSASWTEEGPGFHGESLALEVVARHRLPRRFELSSGLGHYDIGLASADGTYFYWNLTLARSLGPVVLDLGYYDTDSTADRLWPGLAGARAVLAATYRIH